MPRAIIYTRVSTDEQARTGYSLTDQYNRLTAYCAARDIDIAAHFQEDHSAKTFERPAWNELMQHIRRSRGTIDQVLVVKWDRFSRNATDALGMIRTLSRIGVEVQAIEQPINLDIPEQIMMLALYVAAPEVENKRRSQNVRRGMRQAMREGRWISRPPFGYTRCRVDGKTSIEPIDEYIHPIQQAFHLAATSELSLGDIRRQTGLFKEVSRSNFHRMLQQPAYAGLIRLKAHRDQPEELIDAVHEAIISEDLFWSVQRVRFEDADASRSNKKFRAETPLRGVLRCSICGEYVCSSASRSRSGRRYWYYHCTPCQKERRTGHRHRADRVHLACADFLDEIAPHPEVMDVVEKEIKHRYAGSKRERAKKRARLSAAARDVDKKLLRAERMFLDEKIDAETFTRLQTSLRQERASLLEQVNQLDMIANDVVAQVQATISLFRNIGRTWVSAKPADQHAIVGSIFPKGVVYQNDRIRTTSESPVIALFSIKNAEKDERSAAKATERPGRWAWLTDCRTLSSRDFGRFMG